MKFWLVFALFSLVALTVGVQGQEEAADPSPVAEEEPVPEVSPEAPEAEDAEGTAPAATGEAALEPTSVAVATKDEEEEVQDQVVEEVEKEMEEEEEVEHDEKEHKEVEKVVVDENVQEEAVESVAEPESPSTEAQDSSTPGGSSQIGFYFPTIFVSALLALKFAH